VRSSQFWAKACLQRRNRRTLHANLHVPPVVLVLGVSEPLIGDAGPAGEADAPVDNQRLAVRAVIEPSRCCTT
jgi:hypothetical protein